MWLKFQGVWVLLFIYSSAAGAAGAADEGLTGEVLWSGVSSECSQLEARGRGTSQLSERLQDMITFHTMHKNTSTT